MMMEKLFRDLDDVILFTIYIGSNDATIKSSGQYIDIEEYKQNVKKMVEFV